MRESGNSSFRHMPWADGDSRLTEESSGTNGHQLKYDGMVSLKNLLYHLRDSSDPFAILMSIRTITHGKQSGTRNQLGPP
jgi:hypothetical protein